MVSDGNNDSDIDRSTDFLKLHWSSTHAHFILSSGFNEAGRSVHDGFYRLNLIISKKSDFVEGIHSPPPPLLLPLLFFFFVSR